MAYVFNSAEDAILYLGNNILDQTNVGMKTIAVNINGTAQNQVSSANASNAITLAGVSGKKHHMSAVTVSVTGASTTGNQVVTITDNGTTVWSFNIAGATPVGTNFNYTFAVPITSAANNTNMVVTVPALGAAAISTLSILNYDL